MIKVVKRCEYPMLDGFKCNKPYSVSSNTAGTRKFCDDHIGNDRRDNERDGNNGLVRSSNSHAQEGNNEQMRAWLMAKMRAETKDENRLKKLETEIERLDKVIVRSEGNKKKIESVVRKVIKSESVTSKIEGTVVSVTTRTNKRVSDRLQAIEGQLEELYNLINKNKNGDEEE